MAFIQGTSLNAIREALNNNQRLSRRQSQRLYELYVESEELSEVRRNRIQQLEEVIAEMRNDPKFMTNRSAHAVTIIALMEAEGTPISMRKAADLMGISHTAIVAYLKRHEQNGHM